MRKLFLSPTAEEMAVTRVRHIASIYLLCFYMAACSPADRPESSAPTISMDQESHDRRIAPTRAIVSLDGSDARPIAVFVSGHSLVDEPLPQFLVSIARTAKHDLEWNKQTGPGSSIFARTRGASVDGTPWSGYRSGSNRVGKGLDVREELRAPATVRAGRYHALLITEQHGVLGNLLWNDTVRYLRHFHDSYIEANPTGQTFFFEPWLNVDRLDNPKRWIAFTKAESRVWNCATARINASLALTSRADRIVNIPAGVAIAYLLERATSDEGVAALTGATQEDTVRRLFSDDVHLTEAGVYYVALVSYRLMFERESVADESTVPPSVGLALARSLSDIADDFLRARSPSDTAESVTNCPALAGGDFSRSYWSYFRDIRFARDEILPLAYVRTWRAERRWRKLIESQETSNPLYFDASTDSTYWIR